MPAVLAPDHGVRRDHLGSVAQRHLSRFRPPEKKAVKPLEEERVIALIPLPELKELEEPEPVAADDQGEPDPGAFVPMQQDVPQIPLASDFVQQMDFSSLLEQPDFSQVKVLTIPETRAMGRIAEKLGKIFNLSELDRVPEPLVQPPPVYPVSLRREGVRATVQVEFIVNTEGAVINAVAVESTRVGFEAAAIAGVSKWKFRPGMKGGRKVNTRMSVPIIFRIVDEG
jgi:protein TonB